MVGSSAVAQSRKRAQEKEKEEQKAYLVSDHRMLLLILEHLPQNRKCSRIVNLSQTIRQLMSQQRRLSIEPFSIPSKSYQLYSSQAREGERYRPLPMISMASNVPIDLRVKRARKR